MVDAPASLEQHAREPVRVLFVCTGNRCRSPVAERLMRVLVPQSTVRASSAGLSGSWGRPMDFDSAAALRDLGGDPEEFTSRQVTRAVVADVDLVLTATKEQLDQLLSRHPRLLRRAFSLGEAAALAADLVAREQLPAPGADLGTVLSRARTARASTPLDSADVPDPLGLPAEVHRRVATQVAELLMDLKPVLLRGAPASPG